MLASICVGRIRIDLELRVGVPSRADNARSMPARTLRMRGKSAYCMGGQHS